MARKRQLGDNDNWTTAHRATLWFAGVVALLIWFLL